MGLGVLGVVLHELQHPLVGLLDVFRLRKVGRPQELREQHVHLELSLVELNVVSNGLLERFASGRFFARLPQTDGAPLQQLGILGRLLQQHGQVLLGVGRSVYLRHDQHLHQLPRALGRGGGLVSARFLPRRGRPC